MLNELTMWQRGCAAGIASLVSSVFLNPIDVVKVWCMHILLVWGMPP